MLVWAHLASNRVAYDPNRSHLQSALKVPNTFIAPFSKDRYHTGMRLGRSTRPRKSERIESSSPDLHWPIYVMRGVLGSYIAMP